MEWWREVDRLALDDEGYLYLLPVAGDEDTPPHRLGHVEDDPVLPEDMVELEPVKEWLAAERRSEPTRQELEYEWCAYYFDGLE